MNATRKEFDIPTDVARATQTLEEHGFEAFLIGGCVRDLLLGKKPKDWDITTNATPEQIQEMFEHTFYENSFGTVGVVNDEALDETTKVLEITPYRLEADYSDGRRPDSVSFSTKLEDDLKRRDFAMNAIAYSVSRKELVDPYKGEKDIQDKMIRTVGDPNERFTEDALRILRAVRLSAQLDFTINTQTQEAIKVAHEMLKSISSERIRDEFSKLIDSPNPMQGLILSHELSVLQYILPELEAGIGVSQNGDHIYTVWEHNLRAVQHAADKNYPFHVKLAAVLHDISKPETRRWSDEKKDYTFYGHDVVGGRVSKKILQRLKFPKEMTYSVSKLVRHHLFFSDVDQITLSAVRRIIRNVGPDLVWDLMKLRTCDRIGMGRPKEQPYRLRKYESMIEEAMRDPVSVQNLKIDGKRIMEVTRETPGPKIGHILHALLEEVLDDPAKNTSKYLENRALELISLNTEELISLAEAGKKKKEEVENKELLEIRKRHWVK